VCLCTFILLFFLEVNVYNNFRCMEGSFQIIDIILIIGICQGVFLTFTLQRISNNNYNANTILSKLILIATMMLIGRFIYFRYLNLTIFHWSLLVDSLVFLFGPLFYIYIRRLLFKGSTSYLLPIYHAIPFALLAIIALFFLVYFSAEEYYQFYLDGNLKIIFNVISIVMIVSNLYYLFRSYGLIKKFKKEEKQTFSFEQSPVNYLNSFLISFLVCLTAWIVSFINYSVLDRYFTYVNYESVWVAIPILLYVIGYFSLKQPELFRIPLEAKISEKKARLSSLDSDLLKKKLDSLMRNEKVFLQHNLTLLEVAKLLKTSTNNISWLLNNVNQTTFYDYINGYRVKEFVKEVENKKHLQNTILALSIDAGFNSKSTFNKAFKVVMKDTPSNYIKNLPAA